MSAAPSMTSRPVKPATSSRHFVDLDERGAARAGGSVDDGAVISRRERDDHRAVRAAVGKSKGADLARDGGERSFGAEAGPIVVIPQRGVVAIKEIGRANV